MTRCGTAIACRCIVKHVRGQAHVQKQLAASAWLCACYTGLQRGPSAGPQTIPSPPLAIIFKNEMKWQRTRGVSSSASPKSSSTICEVGRSCVVSVCVCVWGGGVIVMHAHCAGAARPHLVHQDPRGAGRQVARVAPAAALRDSCRPRSAPGCSLGEGPCAQNCPAQAKGGDMQVATAM